MTEPAPGQFLDRIAIWWLRDRYACVPLGNGEQQYLTLPVPEAPQGYKLVPAGAEIVPPGARVRRAALPEIGLYVPASERISKRRVIASSQVNVLYRDDDGMDHVVSAESFERWRRRARAVRQEDVDPRQTVRAEIE